MRRAEISDRMRCKWTLTSAPRAAGIGLPASSAASRGSGRRHHRERDQIRPARSASRGREARAQRRVGRDRATAARLCRAHDPAEGASDVSSNEETVKCPKCGERIRLTPEQADYDELIVNCPKCGEQFVGNGRRSSAIGAINPDSVRLALPALRGARGSCHAVVPAATRAGVAPRARGGAAHRHPGDVKRLSDRLATSLRRAN